MSSENIAVTIEDVDVDGNPITKTADVKPVISNVSTKPDDSTKLSKVSDELLDRYTSVLRPNTKSDVENKNSTNALLYTIKYSVSFRNDLTRFIKNNQKVLINNHCNLYNFLATWPEMLTFSNMSDVFMDEIERLVGLYFMTHLTDDVLSRIIDLFAVTTLVKYKHSIQIGIPADFIDETYKLLENDYVATEIVNVMLTGTEYSKVKSK